MRILIAIFALLAAAFAAPQYNSGGGGLAQPVQPAQPVNDASQNLGARGGFGNPPSYTAQPTYGGRPYQPNYGGARQYQPSGGRQPNPGPQNPFANQYGK